MLYIDFLSQKIIFLYEYIDILLFATIDILLIVYIINCAEHLSIKEQDLSHKVEVRCDHYETFISSVLWKKPLSNSIGRVPVFRWGMPIIGAWLATSPNVEENCLSGIQGWDKYQWISFTDLEPEQCRVWNMWCYDWLNQAEVW